MFDNRKLWVVILSLIIGISAFIPAGFAIKEYPWKGAPAQVTFTPIAFPTFVTKNSSLETFVIQRPNETVLGPLPTCSIAYSLTGAFNGSLIEEGEPLNITVTLNINPFYTAIGYFVDPEYVIIDNTEYAIIVGPNRTVDPFGYNEPLGLHLITNSSQNGLIYSTSYIPFNDTFFPTLGNVIIPTSNGFLTGTVFMLVGSRANPNSSSWFQGFSLGIRNVTKINIPSSQDLQLENQTVELENAQLQSDAIAQNSFAESQYNNALVNFLTLVIITFVVADISIAFYELSENKDGEKENKPETPYIEEKVHNEKSYLW